MSNEEVDGSEIFDTFKTLRVFDTMRSDLALLYGIIRRSALEESNYQGEDLGFLCTTDGGLHCESTTGLTKSQFLRWSIRSMRVTKR